MNSTIDLILSHRSIRKFKPDAVDDVTVEKLVRAGQAASSSSFVQAYSIIDITDAQLRQQITQYAGNQRYIAEAPRFLVFCGDMKRLTECAEHYQQKPQMGYTEQLLTASIDAALIAQNIVIAAESLGLGTVFIGAIRNNPEEVSKRLELPDQVIPLFGLCLGYPDQAPGIKPRLPTSVILHTNRYDKESFQRSFEQYEKETAQYYTERTGGKVRSGWAEQMCEKITKESRPGILKFLNQQGFAKR